MRKHFTIEKITIVAFTLSVLLLMLAAFIFYQNSVYLEEIQQKENENASLLNKAINTISSNTVLPDTREVFRPEVLKTDPLAGLQLSIAEYMVAIYILNLNIEQKRTAKPLNSKRIQKYKLKEIDNYQLAAINHKDLLILLIFFLISAIQLSWFIIYKKHKQNLIKPSSSNNIKLKYVLNNFSKFKYTKKIKSSFIYSYSKSDFKHFILFKNKSESFRSVKSGIKMNPFTNRISMKKTENKTKIK